MYYCQDCGALFVEPVIAYDVWLEHFGHPCRKPYEACPKCGSADWFLVLKCEVCGVYTDSSKVEEGFCPDCALAVIKKLNTFLLTLTEREKALLNAKYYGLDVFV